VGQGREHTPDEARARCGPRGFSAPDTPGRGWVDAAAVNARPHAILVGPDEGPVADPDDLLTLVLEVTGERKKEKQAKVATATDLWVPAVNNWGGLGRWAFLEVTDPWDAENLIRARFLSGAPAGQPS